MTVSQLYSATAQLGFETTLEDELEDKSGFYYAVNRAVLQVCRLRPVINVCTINHNTQSNLVEEDTFTPIDKEEDLYFSARNAKSYYFEADGNGAVYIEKYNSDTKGWAIIGTVSLTSEQRAFVAYKGFIKEDGDFTDGLVRLHFTGEYLYSVRNVALFRYILSDSEDDIPVYEPYTRYDISELVDDFLTLCRPPIITGERNEALNQDYEVEGNSKILLPYDLKGVYKILYEHRPTELENSGDASNDETVIDLDEEISSLLPILVGGYVWVDDEPEKAQYYMNLYRERAAIIEQKIKKLSPVSIRSSNGW
ncbi:MAG: hypothetical protein LUD19_06510 [Clostridia bacterium]|nr:hypothetical protein [Clostridia bacterium]